jgi:hypothetical protein
MDTTSKRPPLFAKERADKEQASNNVLRHPKAPGQLSEQTSARMWIGNWIALIVETQQSDERGLCIAHQRYATRTRDPDEAAAAYRAAATRASVDVRITPKGRARGDGLRLAYELKQRGIDVSLAAIDERTERVHEHEFAWADQSVALLDIPRTSFPDWSSP